MTARSGQCHAIACSALVMPDMLMCAAHWKLLPLALKRALWAAHVPGQERTGRASLEYLAAADAAQRYLQLIERELPEFFEPGDALAWVLLPQPLLGGDRPVDLLASTAGWQRVCALIAQLRDGAYV